MSQAKSCWKCTSPEKSVTRMREGCSSGPARALSHWAVAGTRGTAGAAGPEGTGGVWRKDGASPSWVAGRPRRASQVVRVDWPSMPPPAGPREAGGLEVSSLVGAPHARLPIAGAGGPAAAQVGPSGLCGTAGGWGRTDLVGCIPNARGARHCGASNGQDRRVVVERWPKQRQGATGRGSIGASPGARRGQGTRRG